MTLTQRLSRDWLGQPRADVLSGIVVALALIPEAIGFSVVAGVDPQVGLYASVVIATLIAFTGGRVAMISAATASTAVLMGPLVKAHGLGYLLAATVLMGVFQIIAGLLQLGQLMRYMSQSVMTGFVNALAILIFMAQLPQLIGASWQVFALVGLGLAVIYGLPLLTRAVPSQLVSIAVVTLVSYFMQLPVRHVAELGQLPSALPHFCLPDVPWSLDTLQIIAPVALALAAVGLLESLLTAQILDELTDSPSNKTRECVGQGLANIGAALFGGMGGCAMIGQSVINVSAGGRGRLSTLAAGVFLLVLLVLLHGLLAIVPVAALTAVMIMVSINTFSWRSLTDIRRIPWQSSLVMAATVLTVVLSGNLFSGVIVGVLLSSVFFVAKVARLVRVNSHLDEASRTRTYVISGQVFFASASFVTDQIDLYEDVPHIVLDVTDAHFWDISAVSALDRLVLKGRKHGRNVQILGLNEASATLVDRLASHRNSSQPTAAEGPHG